MFSRVHTGLTKKGHSCQHEERCFLQPCKILRQMSYKQQTIKIIFISKELLACEYLLLFHSSLFWYCWCSTRVMSDITSQVNTLRCRDLLLSGLGTRDSGWCVRRTRRRVFPDIIDTPFLLTYSSCQNFFRYLSHAFLWKEN